VRRCRTQRGVAIIFVLVAMMVLSALAMTLALTTSVERQVAVTHGWAAEVFYAADAAFEKAVESLSSEAHWNAVLGGSTSGFVDGAPGPRALPNGTKLDLLEASDALNCGRSPCSDVNMQMTTATRPWGANNPVWRLYAHGPIANMGAVAIQPNVYVVVWVADDPLETDGLALIDGDSTSGPNPGAGLLQVLAQAYGPGGTRRVIEGTLRREDSRTRVISWRELREP
jgi:Tfp pilus assembly protein PilX